LAYGARRGAQGRLKEWTIKSVNSSSGRFGADREGAEQVKAHVKRKGRGEQRKLDSDA